VRAYQGVEGGSDVNFSMVRNKDSAARVKLAGRILTQIRRGEGQSIVFDEIAQLRSLAESAEEFAMPVDQLAQTVIERERKRMGIPSPQHGDWPTGRN